MTEKKSLLEVDDHCDDYISRIEVPECLRYWLLVNRLPATEKSLLRKRHGPPVCYAKYEGEWVRLTMASRFGDIGITKDLKADHGYFARVEITALSDFQEERP